MHVCHITTVHSPQDARIFYRMCQPLARLGLRVTLIAPGHLHDSRVFMSPYNARLFRASRPLRSLLALRAALAERADLYHLHDPELIGVGLALKARGHRVIYDVHEDYPAQMLVKYWIPASLRPLVARGMRAANTLAGWCFDGMVTADPAVAAQFPPARTRVFYNFPIPEFFVAPARPPLYDVVYLGGLSARTGMEVLLDALAQLKAQGQAVSAHLAGYTDGEAGLTTLTQAIAARGLTQQVRVSGRLAHTDVPAFLHSGRIGVVPLQPIPKFLSNIPTKLFEYWACGLPVVVGTLPPILPFVRDGVNGFLFTPTSATELTAKVAWLLAHPVDAQRMGQAGQAQVRELWHNAAQVEHLRKLYSRCAVACAPHQEGKT